MVYNQLNDEQNPSYPSVERCDIISHTNMKKISTKSIRRAASSVYHKSERKSLKDAA